MFLAVFPPPGTDGQDGTRLLGLRMASRADVPNQRGDHD